MLAVAVATAWAGGVSCQRSPSYPTGAYPTGYPAQAAQAGQYGSYQAGGQRLEPQSSGGGTYSAPAASAPSRGWPSTVASGAPAPAPASYQASGWPAATSQASSGGGEGGLACGSRGSGTAWRAGKSPLRAHKARENKAPSVAAPNWQSAPYYSQTPAAPPTQYGAPSGYGAASGGYAPDYGGGYGERLAPGVGGAASGGKTYLIQKGDTLSAMARRHQISLGALLSANGLTMDELIFPGRSLTIPGR